MSAPHDIIDEACTSLDQVRCMLSIAGQVEPHRDQDLGCLIREAAERVGAQIGILDELGEAMRRQARQ